MRTNTLGGALATALITIAALGGCAATGEAPAPPAAPPAPAAAAGQAHNQADISFAQGMIPHHAQAVDMAKLAPTRAGSPKVKELAGAIQGAQQPEIDQMTGFLRAWQAPVPGTGDQAMGGMQHSGHSMPGAGRGMMTAEQMTELERSNGPAFDRLFLRMMVDHHRGAITMANTELAEGQNPEAKQLARRIVDAQQREIDEMTAILGS